MSDVSRRSILQLAIAPALFSRSRAPRQDLPPTVSLVHPGLDGKLAYVPDEHGNTILDSSHAGYGGGGVAIPTVPVKETIWPVAGDNTAAVQAAIDKVSALPLDRSGFRGAHSFMTGQPTASGNVFLDCKATRPYSSSEPHERWATGSLYDNVEAPLTARFWKNINIGWAGANTVFWNCVGSFLVQKPPTAQNFAFGHVGVGAVVFNIPLQDPAKEVGRLESIDRHVTRRSLYLTQLRDRLGEIAVRHVAAPGQTA